MSHQGAGFFARGGSVLRESVNEKFRMIQRCRITAHGPERLSWTPSNAGIPPASGGKTKEFSVSTRGITSSHTLLPVFPSAALRCPDQLHSLFESLQHGFGRQGSHGFSIPRLWRSAACSHQLLIQAKLSVCEDGGNLRNWSATTHAWAPDERWSCARWWPLRACSSFPEKNKTGCRWGIPTSRYRSKAQVRPADGRGHRRAAHRPR